MDCPAEVALAELVSSGEPVLVVASDARRRWATLGGATGISRFIGADAPEVGLLWSGSPDEASRAFAASLSDSVGLCDYAALGRAEQPFRPAGAVLLFDPPSSAAQRQAASQGGVPVIEVADPASYVFAERCVEDRHELTGHLRALYRALRGDEQFSGDPLRNALEGDPDLPHSPESAAILLRVLVEAGAARTDGSGGARGAGIVSSEKVELDSSPLFRAQARIHKEQIAFLRQLKK